MSAAIPPLLSAKVSANRRKRWLAWWLTSWLAPTSSSWLNRVGRLLTIPVGDRGTLKWVSRRALLYAVLVIGALVFAYPFLWMIFTSLRAPTAVYQNSLQLIPRSFDWADYPQALNQFPFAEGLENTLIITVGVMVGTLVNVTLAAYAFSRLQFKFRDPLFYLCLSTMMIPYQVILLPQYILFRHLGWVGTFLPLIVPAFFAGVPRALLYS